ncbi:DNA adenine methylase [uncultured Alistipes sp.]|uniref:DNA adenine methylase n=1 Tax=Alistipes sp. TaxID=1872444 RepID=UPI002592D0C3|nr:DNA adenine methylase [uncultured Alistipes sp.]
MSAKVYNASPLPFMGQKRRFVSQFRKALQEFPAATTFVDLFGGSGLLSHVVKRQRPDARVIYNDFDDFHLRIENIERTNVIIAEIRTMLAGLPRMKKVPEHERQAIINLLKRHEQNGFVDYVTISSSILFSGKYATNIREMEKQTFYNTPKLTPYNCDGYLDGLEIVKADYRELFAQYANTPNVVFLVDPPYLSTQTGHYENYWRLADYLDVFATILRHPFFYFTSNKSSVIEFFDWMDAHGFGSPFKEVTRKEIENSVNYHARYTDIMLYKA